MKVKELIEELKLCDPESEVIIQKDSEGNGYSPCNGADNEAVYVPDTAYSGIVYDTKWTAGDCCMEEFEWEELKNTAQRAVVLYPIN